MDDDEFQALARRHAYLALKFLADIAVDPKANPPGSTTRPKRA
jgi:hypothetical protein